MTTKEKKKRKMGEIVENTQERKRMLLKISGILEK